MVVTEGRIKGFSANRIWFWNGETLKIKNTVFNRYLRVNSDTVGRFEGQIYVTDYAYTLVSNLCLEREELFNLMKKNYRNEIRRAQKENNKIEFFVARDLTANPSILIDFRKTYIKFCNQLGNKSLIKDLDMKKVQSYIDADCIMISRASNSKNGVWVYHLYVTDSNNALLCYSASVFRNENADSAAAGRANKQLHWEDMCIFKERGVRVYDWGNVSVGEPEEYNGIDRFKAGFGGVPQNVVNFLVANTLVGKSIIKITRRYGAK